MKNLKMFAVAVMAFAVMAMGVRATSNPTGGYTNAKCDPDTETCYAKIGDHYYSYLSLALIDAKDGDTIELLADIGTNGLGTIANADLGKTTGLTKKLTINVGDYDLTIGGTMFVGKNGDLTIKGNGIVSTTGSTKLLVVKNEGSLTTEGVLLSTNGARLIAVEGKAVLGEGTELSGASSALVEATAATADITLNARVGKDAAYAHTIVAINSSVTPIRNKGGVKVTFAGGEYNTTASIMTIIKSAVVTVNGGTFNVGGSSSIDAFVVTDGSLTITGGDITAEGKVVNIAKGTVLVDGGKLVSNQNATIYTSASTEGSLAVKKGTVISKSTSPLYLDGGKLTYKIEGATFEGPKETPAIYIDDDLLTGMKDGGKEDHFKGMITGGKYLYMIVGEAKKADGAPEDYTAEEVARYLIATGLEERTEGNYKLVGNGAGDTPAGEPGTTEPGDSTIPPVPQTNDNILVYAGLGLVSLASVAFTTRKRED